MKFKNLLFATVILFSCGINAQDLFPPTEIIQGTFLGTTIPLRDFPVYEENFNPENNTITIVQNGSRYNAKVNEGALPLNDIELNVQKVEGGIQAYAPTENFGGITGNSVFPPDPTGAVGPNHYVHSVNSLVKIYDKTGTTLAGPVSLASFLGMSGNLGDPIVLYDHLADRYIVTQFGDNSQATNSIAFGISVTNDPTGSYNVYQYTFSGFPDYPKWSVWPDGYYLTMNKLGGNSLQIFVAERDVMLAGGANPQLIGLPLPGWVENPNTIESPAAANLTGSTFPASVPGYVVYLQDDGWAGVTFDHLKVWEINVDFVTPGNSTISSALEIPTDPFNSVFAPFGTGDVGQPGTGQKIDMQGGIISFASNYRSFADHNSWVITFNTDIDGNDTSGIRWIELRNDDINPWEIYQEGTYAPADGHSRFMSSAAMDAAGNIGMGFQIASSTLKATMRYTGRFDGDPLGDMTFAETNIIDGVGVQTFTNRFGDYSHLTMDPDDFTFWYTGEYFPSTNSWRTQIASFSIFGAFDKDVGVVNIIEPNNGVLTSTETVEVSIRNFGSDPQSNIDLELRVDGNLEASETYNGTINPNESATYTFTQTVDLSNAGNIYEINVATDLGGDEFIDNDDFTKNVTHLLGNNVGSLGVTSPYTGTGLGTDETITVKIKNFGIVTQSNFDVQYSINGGTPVVENFAGPITSEDIMTFNFAQTADFSALGTYNVTVSTLLAGDENASDDESLTVIENSICQPSPDCSLGHGLQLVNVAEINNPSGCEGYADFTSLVANIEPGTTSNLTLTTGFGDQWVTVFIDFNDDNDFSFPGEAVINNHVMAEGEGAGTYTETIDLILGAGVELGEHRMRIKTNWQAPVVNGCDNTQVGETEDYTISVGTLGVEDFEINNSELMIVSSDNNHFEISLKSEYDGAVYLTIHNVLGQQLGYKMIPKSGDDYNFNIDMSEATSGVYLIKVGGKSTTTFKTGRIIVK